MTGVGAAALGRSIGEPGGLEMGPGYLVYMPWVILPRVCRVECFVLRQLPRLGGRMPRQDGTTWWRALALAPCGARSAA